LGLFDKIKEPVFVKESSSASTQLNELLVLADTAPTKVKTQIDQDIKILSAGIYGEQNIAFELRNSHTPMMILHDLYIVYGDLSAQIDYLIVTRKRIFVVECKNLIGDIEINSSGDFIRTVNYNGKNKKEGIYSPITQNQHHLELIKQIRCGSKNNFLTKALFEKYFYDNYRSIVVLANPKTILNAKYAKREVKQQVIRADQLIDFIKNVNSEPGADSMNEQQMEEIAYFFFNQNRDNPMDYINKYRTLIHQENETLSEISAINKSFPDSTEVKTYQPEHKEKTIIEEKIVKSTQSVKGSEDAALVCPKCGAPMIKRKASKGINVGSEFYGCTNFPKCRCIINIK
jgi:hypothetical protein